MNKGIIICGFKAIGKSTVARKYENIIDLESSDYKYILDECLKDISVEKTKGLKERKLNPEYPYNYYDKIIDEYNQGKAVLIACKIEIVELLEKNNVEYYIIYPKEEMLEEIIERCKSRGNIDEFIINVRKAYNRDFPKDKNNVIWMKKGEYLENILKDNKLFELKIKQGEVC